MAEPREPIGVTPPEPARVQNHRSTGRTGHARTDVSARYSTRRFTMARGTRTGHLTREASLAGFAGTASHFNYELYELGGTVSGEVNHAQATARPLQPRHR